MAAGNTRLQEHAGQMERRLAGLEARFAVEVQARHHQGRRNAESSEKQLAEKESRFRQGVEALRSSPSRICASRRKTRRRPSPGEADTRAEITGALYGSSLPRMGTGFTKRTCALRRRR
jgi:hypothetical protein